MADHRPRLVMSPERVYRHRPIIDPFHLSLLSSARDTPNSGSAYCPERLSPWRQ
jgi:hypothetical protein